MTRSSIYAPQSSILDPRSSILDLGRTMNRIFSSVDRMFVAIYYAAIFMTPANLRGAARVIGTLGLRIADFARSFRGAAPQAALIFCGLMFASAPGLGQTAQSTIPESPSAISAALPQ